MIPAFEDGNARIAAVPGEDDPENLPPPVRKHLVPACDTLEQEDDGVGWVSFPEEIGPGLNDKWGAKKRLDGGRLVAAKGYK
jgi:hypothetical protein